MLEHSSTLYEHREVVFCPRQMRWRLRANKPQTLGGRRCAPGPSAADMEPKFLRGAPGGCAPWVRERR